MSTSDTPSCVTSYHLHTPSPTGQLATTLTSYHLHTPLSPRSTSDDPHLLSLTYPPSPRSTSDDPHLLSLTYPPSPRSTSDDPHLLSLTYPSPPGQLATTLSSATESLRLARSFCYHTPTLPQRSHQVATACQRLAVALLRSGQWLDAIGYAQEALEISTRTKLVIIINNSNLFKVFFL